MGLFSKKPNVYEENGFIIDADSHIISAVPKDISIYRFPTSAKGLSVNAIAGMIQTAEKIIVPASFDKFSGDFSFYKKLRVIVLEEGVKELDCQVDKNVDFQLPKSIKKLGSGNYPIVQNLIIPDGVIELGTLFASHDTNLISVEIPGSIKNIPSYAFNQCKNLQSVILHEGVETCAENFLRGTNNLSKLQIPSTFSGKFMFLMENRNISKGRNNSSYSNKNFDQEMARILSIIIKRDGKEYTFKVRRGEIKELSAKNNVINIQMLDGNQFSIDSNKYSEATYIIENGQLLTELELSKSKNVANTEEKKEEVKGTAQQETKIEETKEKTEEKKEEVKGTAQQNEHTNDISFLSQVFPHATFSNCYYYFSKKADNGIKSTPIMKSVKELLAEKEKLYQMISQVQGDYRYKKEISDAIDRVYANFINKVKIKVKVNTSKPSQQQVKPQQQTKTEKELNDIIIEGCKNFIIERSDFKLLTIEQKNSVVAIIKDIYYREYQKNKKALKEQIIFENYYTEAIATLLKENFQYLFNSLIMNRPDYQNMKPEIQEIIEERIKDEYLKNYKNSKSLSFNTSFFETICSEIINTNQNIEKNEIGLVEKSKNLLSGIFPNEDLDNYSSSPESKDLRQLKTKEELIEDEQYLKTILAMDDKLTIKQKIIAMQAIEKLYESYYLIVNSVHQNEEVISR